MTNLMGTEPDKLRLKYITSEMQGLRDVITYLYGGNQGAFTALMFIKGNYKQWPDILKWLKANQLHGQKLVEFFQNESPDGGGYHMGVTLILARLKGQKFNEDIIKIDQLI